MPKLPSPPGLVPLVSQCNATALVITPATHVVHVTYSDTITQYSMAFSSSAGPRHLAEQASWPATEQLTSWCQPPHGRPPQNHKISVVDKRNENKQGHIWSCRKKNLEGVVPRTFSPRMRALLHLCRNTMPMQRQQADSRADFDSWTVVEGICDPRWLGISCGFGPSLISYAIFFCCR